MRSVLHVLMVLLAMPALTRAADIAGTYKGSSRGTPLVVRVEKSADAYSGTITLDQQTYTFTADLKDDVLDGTFNAGGGAFPFTLTRKGDGVVLATGKSQYALDRVGDQPAADRAPGAGDGKSIVFTKYTMIEPGERIKVAHWLMPKGWKVDGRVLWRHDRALYATVDVRVYNPETFQQLRGIPAEIRSTPTQPGQRGLDFEGIEYAPLIESPADYITQIAIPLHCRDVPQYRVVGYEPLPKLAERARESGLPLGGPGVNVSASAGRLRIEYLLNGEAVEEDFYCSLVYIDCRMKWQQRGLPNGPIQYVPNDLYSIRARKGGVDEITPVMHAIMSTTYEDIQMFALRQKIDKIRAEGAAERLEFNRRSFEKIRQTQLEITDIITRGYKERQASQERIQRKTVDAIQGVDRFVDPMDTERQVKLPTGYDKAWSNGLGEYIVSNDAFFDPNQNSSQKWEPMQRAKD